MVVPFENVSALGIGNETYSKQSNQHWLKLGLHKSLTACLTGSLMAGCLILKIHSIAWGHNLAPQMCHTMALKCPQAEALNEVP